QEPATGGACALVFTVARLCDMLAKTYQRESKKRLKKKSKKQQKNQLLAHFVNIELELKK
ncbi:hypothetical protein, partial [Klebsiella pneumoniae]|uniref:hypothetical protein n=1 Tax=Klebsiella pneumoniae TaxID=573 RepID=UPI001966D2BC